LERQHKLEKFIAENKITANNIVTVVPTLSPNKRAAKLKKDLSLYDEVNERVSSMGLSCDEVHRLHNRLYARECRNTAKEGSEAGASVKEESDVEASVKEESETEASVKEESE